MSEIRPHAGPQEAALASSADIVIMGGAKGGGKTRALLMEPLRHMKNPNFSAVIFRRESPQITNPGGLWDASQEIYPRIGARPRIGSLEWVFPSGMKIKFSHMEYEQDKFAWDGSQVPLICFDQVESFTEGQFWYMLTINRSLCGVRPYIRASCNPVPEDDQVGGWLHTLIQWWIDPETGQAIEQRRGKLRWFVRDNDELRWSEDPISLAATHPTLQPKSLTFIQSKLEDNPTLMRGNPEYLANLMALPLIERERLLGGNWNARPAAGKVFNRTWFDIVDAVPAEAMSVRAWDKAGTEGAGDWTAGVRMARAGGLYFVEDVVRGQWGSASRNAVIRQTAALDGPEVEIALEQEPGSGGKESAEISIRDLAGYNVHAHPATGSKYIRALPMSAQAEAKNIKLIRGAWNKSLIDELHGFTGNEGAVDDQVDAAASAFNRLALRPGPLEMWGGTVSRAAGNGNGNGDGNENPEPDEEKKRLSQEAVLSQIRTHGVYWPAGRP